MEITSFFDSSIREHLLAEIAKCDWRAGRYLHDMLINGTFRKKLGEGSELLLLTDGGRLVSFCTFAQRDEIPSDTLTPWIGFVYTFPEYRGRHCFGLLLERIAATARERGISRVYISTDHTGLYEKYGFEYLGDMLSIYGDMARVYALDVKKL